MKLQHMLGKLSPASGTVFMEALFWLDACGLTKDRQCSPDRHSAAT